MNMEYFDYDNAAVNDVMLGPTVNISVSASVVLLTIHDR